MRRFRLTAALAASLLLAAPVAAQAPDVAAAMALVEAGRPTDAIPILTTLADAGNAEAQFQLARLYYTGAGTERNFEEAARLYRLAADQGLAAAQYGLAERYRLAEGVPGDLFEAARWYQLAADQGHIPSIYRLGIAYANGQGVTQDFARAVELMRTAADQLYVAAIYALGAAYAGGQGVTQDPVEAFRWFLIAQILANQPPGGPIYEAVNDAALDVLPADRVRIEDEAFAFIEARRPAAPAAPGAAPAPAPAPAAPPAP